jgi:hypothetical protein
MNKTESSAYLIKKNEQKVSKLNEKNESKSLDLHKN